MSTRRSMLGELAPQRVQDPLVDDCENERSARSGVMEEPADR